MSSLRLIWLILGWLWVAVIFYLSLVPSPPQPVNFPDADKIEHALAYCLLMLWFCQVCLQRLSRVRLAVMLIMMGVAIEYLQRLTGYRTFDYADMLANAAGVMVGWLLAAAGIVNVYKYIERYFSGQFGKAELDQN
jgi:VanZ family protein